jgi:hypothetical protein
MLWNSHIRVGSTFTASEDYETNTAMYICQIHIFRPAIHPSPAGLQQTLCNQTLQDLSKIHVLFAITPHMYRACYRSDPRGNYGNKYRDSGCSCTVGRITKCNYGPVIPLCTLHSSSLYWARPHPLRIFVESSQVQNHGQLIRMSG